MTASVATSQPAANRRRLFPHGHPGLVLGLILTCQLMVVLDATVVNIALKDIKDALHFSTANLSWVVDAYTLTFGGLLLLGARAGDILGRRRVFLVGIALFTVSSLVGGFAQNAGELLAARAVQGIGGALATPSALALLTTMFPAGRERTRAIGLYTAVSIGGSAVGIIAGGMLSQWGSWRWVLFVNVPIGVVVLALARLVLPETGRNRGRFDLAGAITSTLGMSALVFAFVRAATEGWSDAGALASFAVSALLLVSFVMIERRAESPITPLRLFADRNRASSYGARMLQVAGMMGMFFFLTQFLRDILGFSDLRTGFAFVPLTATVFIASQISSRVLVERFGGRRIMLAGLSLASLGMLGLTQVSVSSTYLTMLVPLVVFGFGNGLASVALTNASLDGVEPSEAGAASGLVNMTQQLGGSVGLAVLVTVAAGSHATAAAGSASEVARHAFVHSTTNAFWMATALIASAVVLVAVAIRPRPTEDVLVDLPVEALAFAE